MPELPKNAPAELFIQWLGDEAPYPDADFDTAHAGDVTWCQDRIFPSDLRYVHESALLPQPIEEAPKEIKDGRRVMLYWGPKSYESSEGYWDDHEGLWWSYVAGDFVSPTHYFEIPALPPSPKVEEEDSDE